MEKAFSGRLYCGWVSAFMILGLQSNQMIEVHPFPIARGAGELGFYRAMIANNLWKH